MRPPPAPKGPVRPGHSTPGAQHRQSGGTGARGAESTGLEPCSPGTGWGLSQGPHQGLGGPARSSCGAAGEEAPGRQSSGDRQAKGGSGESRRQWATFPGQQNPTPDPGPEPTHKPLNWPGCSSESLMVPFPGHAPSRLLARASPGTTLQASSGATWHLGLAGPAGVTGNTASWGLGGGGQPSPPLFQAGHLLGGRPGWGALSGGVGSVRLLRCAAPVPRLVWARAALGDQGWGPWRPAGPAGIDCWFLFIEHRGWTRRFAKPKRHSAAATRY